MLKVQLVNNLFNISNKNTDRLNIKEKELKHNEQKIQITSQEPTQTSRERNDVYTESVSFTNLNTILERNHISNEIKEILNSFESNCKSINFKKGIYIYGSPGCGKTRFIVDLLTSLNYDIIKYDAGDVRNKTLIDTITSNNISNCNVLQLMSGNIKKIAILMDEIDGMNNGDKGGITSLIKLIRQKKTKKQKSEHITLNPIICIGNYYVDKKIKELMKVCNVFELKTPTNEQINTVIQQNIPISLTSSLKTIILNYIQGDLVKLKFIINLYQKKPNLLTEEILSAIFVMKSYNYDAKKITHTLINTPVTLEDHATFMNETDRTIVSLLYHENIIDVFSKSITSPTSLSCEQSFNDCSLPATTNCSLPATNFFITPHNSSFMKIDSFIVKDKLTSQKKTDGNITKKNREINDEMIDIKSSKKPTKNKKKSTQEETNITTSIPTIITNPSTKNTQKQTKSISQYLNVKEVVSEETVISQYLNVKEVVSGETVSFLDFYLKVLDNICYADYIDRITFQNQIWVFNEMSSLIKTFYNNYIYHKTFPNNRGKFQPDEVRFTKVLTKYSTEYNNQLFIYNFCQELNMDKRDMKAFFKELRLIYGKTFYNQSDKLNQVMAMFETLNISKLDVKRIYRFLDKNVKFTESIALNDVDEEDDELDIE